jgi:hypothetical protein
MDLVSSEAHSAINYWLLVRAYPKSRIFARLKNLKKIGPQNQLFDVSADFSTYL